MTSVKPSVSKQAQTTITDVADNSAAADKSPDARVSDYNFKPIGKYRLHIPSLIRLNTIKIFFKSDKLIPKHIYPRHIISDQLKKIILELVDDKKFSEDSYKNLEKKEQEIFDDLIQFTKLDYISNRLFREHKHYNADNNKKVIERFNLLKGQIIAGNDNPQILKEIKKHLLYLKMNNLVDKKDVDDILYYLIIT